MECFSSAVNAAVVRLPERRFPGVVLQGDSLKILVDLVDDVARLSQDSGNTELQDAVSELKQNVVRYLDVYEGALRAHGEPFPYTVNHNECYCLLTTASPPMCRRICLASANANCPDHKDAWPLACP